MKILLMILATCSSALSAAPQLWLGASGGYTHIVPDGSGQTSKNGYHLFLTASGEVLTPSYAFAFGGGMFYSRVYSGGERYFPTDDPEVVREQRNLRIETRAGSLELASRYRLWSGTLEAGLLLRHLFGSSLSFSQDKDDGQGKFFFGPQLVLKTAASEKWMQRVDMSLTTDANVPDRRVYLLSAGVALGRSWPIVRPAEPNPVPVPPPSPVAKAAPAERFEEILADKVINFPSASSELQPTPLAFLRDLGRFLAQHGDAWQSMTVEGHTDKKGKLEYNMKLSQDRADSVRRALIDSAVPKERLSAEGFGPTRPLKEGDTPDVLAHNRRVVMVFSTHSREGRNQLSAEIKRLRKLHFGE